MKLTHVGQIYVTRKLLLKYPVEKEVIIQIGSPQPFPASSDYFCPYQILGMSDESVNYCGGIDEIQALILTLERIGSVLYASNEYKKGYLSWEGSEKGNLGFPIVDSVQLISELDLPSFK